MGCVWVASGVLKLGRTDPADVVALGIAPWAATPAATAVPVVRGGGRRLRLFVDGWWPEALALAVFVAFTAVVVRALVRGSAVLCRCFGSLSRRPVSTLTAARNLFFVALARRGPRGRRDGLHAVVDGARRAARRVARLDRPRLRRSVSCPWPI